MKKRQVKIVVLCEDGEHESFVCGYLGKHGYVPGRYRVLKSRPGVGSGKRFVQLQYVTEVAEMRRYHRINKPGSYGLLALIDADADTVDSVYRGMDDRLEEAQLGTRGSDESIALLVPKRNIGTWTYHLLDTARDVDESTDYERRHSVSHPDFRQAGVAFASYSSTAERLPSLLRGCKERDRIPGM